MNELNLSAKITVYSYDELSEVEKNLITAARLSSAEAYAPYSHFWVGAAVLATAAVLSGVALRVHQLLRKEG